MGRKPRIDAPDTWHHVMNRGSGRRNVFSSDADRSEFLDVLSAVSRRFDVQLHAYCLMGNHFHLLVRSEQGRLSEAMQHLGGVFTRRINRRRGVDGPVFRGRFHSLVVSDDGHLVHLVKYIHRNPVDVGWVDPLGKYPWSSHGAYLGTAPVPWWLDQSVVLALFAGDVHRYRAFVELDGDDLADDLGAAPSIAGPSAKTPPPAESGAGAAGPGAPSLDDVLATVAELAGVAVRDLRIGGRGTRNDPRLVAVFVASRTTTSAYADLAGAFGFAGASGVRSAVARAAALLQEDPLVHALAAEAVRRLVSPPIGSSDLAA